MRLSVTCCLSLCLVAAATGCSTTAMPNWCNPGPESYQRNLAKKYDPYPDPNIAPPVVGGRPLGFIEPRPEPDVTKNAKYNPWGG